MTQYINVNGKRVSIEEFQKSDNLSVGGFLDLEGTQITALPDNLSVGGSLYLGYEVTFPVAGKMKIGCQHHEISKWERFTDSEIAAMDGREALKFWKRWKDVLIPYAKAVDAKREKKAA